MLTDRLTRPAAPEMPELARQLEQLKSSKALLDDYAAQLAEAEKIKGSDPIADFAPSGRR